ncbi:MAG: bluetail domain-containing putative surface protein, partial [Prochlorococcaceae cyanobacterium]
PIAAAIYRWTTLGDSVLKGPRRSVRWDVVTNYQAGDQIDAPESIIPENISQASGSIRKLNPGQINSKGVGGEAFEANTARAFLYTGSNKGLQNGVFLVLNDGRAGYQHRSDALIFLQGFSFGSEEATISFLQPAPIAPASEPAPA